jgi:hypothetical protein
MDWVHINYNKLPVKSIGYADSNRHKDFAPTPLIIMDSEVVLLGADYLDRNISTVGLRRKYIAHYSCSCSSGCRRKISLKKAAALTVGDTENAKLGKVECTSSAWF